MGEHMRSSNIISKLTFRSENWLLGDAFLQKVYLLGLWFRWSWSALLNACYRNLAGSLFWTWFGIRTATSRPSTLDTVFSIASPSIAKVRTVTEPAFSPTILSRIVLACISTSLSKNFTGYSGQFTYVQIILLCTIIVRPISKITFKLRLNLLQSCCFATSRAPALMAPLSLSIPVLLPESPVCWPFVHLGPYLFICLHTPCRPMGHKCILYLCLMTSNGTD